MRVDGLTATAHWGMGKAAQCGMLTRGQWDGPEICNEVWRHVSAIHKYFLLFHYYITIICIISLLFLMFTIICVICYYFVQENKIIEIIVKMRNNSNE